MGTLNTSQIDSLLENASPTDPVLLEELLSQEDILQECKNQNKKLVEFLCNSEVLSELIRLIITEPPPASPPTSSAGSSPKKEAETSEEVKEEQSKAIVIVDKEAVDAVEKDDAAEKNSSD